MKLVTFEAGSGPRLGALVGDEVIDLAKASGGTIPHTMNAFLAGGSEAMEEARRIISEEDVGVPAASVRLLAPVPNPSKVVAIGLNYMDHCREQGIDPPKIPTVFTKFTTSIIGPGDEIRWDPDLTSQVDYEVELAVVIGKKARNVPAAEWESVIAGYTICHDVSARDLQFGDGQWVRGKSLDTFCPIGPYLATPDEIGDPHNLKIRCLVNGEALQDSSTSELIFKLPDLIEFCSRAFTLLPGDVIITGTPDGVGIFRDPQVLLKDGDEVSCEVEGLGVLTNRCVEEKK